MLEVEVLVVEEVLVVAEVPGLEVLESGALEPVVLVVVVLWLGVLGPERDLCPSLSLELEDPWACQMAVQLRMISFKHRQIWTKFPYASCIPRSL